MSVKRFLNEVTWAMCAIFTDSSLKSKEGYLGAGISPLEISKRELENDNANIRTEV